LHHKINQENAPHACVVSSMKIAQKLVATYGIALRSSETEQACLKSLPCIVQGSSVHTGRSQTTAGAI